MINDLMRSNQRWMMILISVLVIISFLWFYSDRTNIDRMVSDRAGTIYGRTITTHELNLVDRRLRIAGSLGAYDLLRMVTAGGFEQDRSEAPVNYLVLEHEADKLGIRPTPEEIRTAGEQLSAFRGTGGEYDHAKYDAFVANVLNPAGMGPNQIDEIVRMNLIAAKLQAVVSAPVVVSPVEARTEYDEARSKTEASVIRIKAADVPPVAEPTEEEIAKYFNDQKGQFKQPERRKVQYVKFALDEAQSKLKGKERMEALKPLADRAVDLLEKLLDQKGKEDFAATAAAAQLPVKETPEFEESQTTGFEEASIPQFTEAAFRLSKANPDSDVPLGVPLNAPDSFYDLHLSGVTPERPLTLDEARPKVIAAIKAERSTAALAAKAEEIRTKITDALKAGKSFADAAKEAGQTVDNLPPFSRYEPAQGVPDESMVAAIAQELPIGELSKFAPGGDGGLLVYVRNRFSPDEASYEKDKTMAMTQMQRQKDLIYFYEWLRSSRESANPRFNVQREG